MPRLLHNLWCTFHNILYHAVILGPYRSVPKSPLQTPPPEAAAAAAAHRNLPRFSNFRVHTFVSEIRLSGELPPRWGIVVLYSCDTPPEHFGDLVQYSTPDLFPRVGLVRVAESRNKLLHIFDTHEP